MIFCQYCVFGIFLSQYCNRLKQEILATLPDKQIIIRTFVRLLYEYL